MTSVQIRMIWYIELEEHTLCFLRKLHFYSINITLYLYPLSITSVNLPPLSISPYLSHTPPPILLAPILTISALHIIYDVYYVCLCYVHNVCLLNHLSSLCSSVCGYTIMCTRVYLCVPMCTRVYPCVSVCIRVYPCVPMCTRVYMHNRKGIIVYLIKTSIRELCRLGYVRVTSSNKIYKHFVHYIFLNSKRISTAI